MKRKSIVDYFADEDVLKRNKVNEENSTVYSVMQSYLTSPFHGQINTNTYCGQHFQSTHQSSEDTIQSYSSYDTKPNYSSSSSGYSNDYGIHKRNNISKDHSKVSNGGGNIHLKYRQDDSKAYNSVYDSRQNNTTRQYINDSRQNNYTTRRNNVDSALNFSNNANYRQNNYTTHIHDNNTPNENHNSSKSDYNTPYNFFKFKRAPYQSGRNLNYDPNRDDYNSHYVHQIELSSPSSNKNLESFLNDSISISIDILPRFSTLFEGYSKYIILLILLFVYKCTIS